MPVVSMACMGDVGIKSVAVFAQDVRIFTGSKAFCYKWSHECDYRLVYGCIVASIEVADAKK